MNPDRKSLRNVAARRTTEAWLATVAAGRGAQPVALTVREAVRARITHAVQVQQAVIIQRNATNAARTPSPREHRVLGVPGEPVGQGSKHGVYWTDDPDIPEIDRRVTDMELLD